MPVSLTDLEEIVHWLGESVQGDERLTTWGVEHELPGTGVAKLYVTLDGVDYVAEVRRADGSEPR